MMFSSQPAAANASLYWNFQSPSQPPTENDVPFSRLSNYNTSQLLSWGLDNYASMVCIFGLLAILKSYLGKLQALLEDHFTSTIHVKATDETYDMVLFWVSSRGLDNLAKSIIARVGTKWKVRDGLSTNGKKPICISPWNGGFWFRFRGTFLSYQTQTVSSGLHKEEVITITCLGRSAQVLKDLIEECRVEYLKQGQNKLSVFKNYGDYWKKTTTQKKRPLSTVITSMTQKQDLINDVKEFLHPQTQAWYSKRGIPYRRGFLLYGPPGTGKTSLVSAVAGEFDLDIRIISIPSVDDTKLEGLFDSLPERCVVLLEDIDAVETNRSQTSDPSQKKKAMISLSGLLNTLDGVASQEGRILFMTTNHIEKLDGALKRPGRIDKEFEIKLANKDVIIDLFKFIFKQDACRSIRANIEEAGTKEDEERVTQEKLLDARPILMKHLLKLTTWWQSRCSIQENVLIDQEERIEGQIRGNQEIPNMRSDHVNELATSFADKVPEFKFSTAQIMSHLLQYKYSPEDAVKHAEDWMEKLRTNDTRPPTENSEPSKDILWMKGCSKESSGTDRLKKIKKFSNLRLTVPVSPPPSPCHSHSQPCSASTHFSLSTVGDAAECAISIPTCIHIDNHSDSSTCATRSRAKTYGNPTSQINPTNEERGVDIDSLLGDIGEDKANEPEDVLEKNHLSVAKSGLLSHTEVADMEVLLDDGATRMSDDDRRRLHIQNRRDVKSSSADTTLASLPGSDNRSRLLETEPEGGNGARQQARMAGNTIIVTTSMEQVVTRNTGPAENSNIHTEIKAISPSNVGNTNAAPCLTPMSSSDSLATSMPSNTQIGVAHLRPLPINLNKADKMELPEPYYLFNSNRDNLLQDNTSLTVYGSEDIPVSCNIGRLSISELGTSMSSLLDQTKYYGGTDVNDCLPSISEFVSRHNTEEAMAKNNTQTETGGFSSTTVKVSSFSTPPLSAVDASVAKIHTPSAETDVQVDLAVEAKKPCDDSKAEGVADICGIVDFDLNCGARKITEKDFVTLGLDKLRWARPSDATTPPPSMGIEDLRGPENVPRDSPFLATDASARDEVGENLAGAKTGINNGDLRQSLDCPPTKAKEELQTYDSPRTPNATDWGSADGSVWVKVEIDTNDLPTQMDIVEAE